MWRDERLVDWHAENGLYFPAAGMAMPFIEYDNGRPVGLISYHRKGAVRPTGTRAVEAHVALCGLAGTHQPSVQLPLFTVVYDPATWTYLMLGHNGAARDLVKGLFGPAEPWRAMNEIEFARVLYAMRGRDLPNLSRYGIGWGTGPYETREESWPGELMSRRRRNFEPHEHVSPSKVIPCTDIDLMIPSSMGPGSHAGLLVDYKLSHTSTRLDRKSSSLSAMAGLSVRNGDQVPAMVAHYDPFGGSVGEFTFTVTCLNGAASRLLCYVLGATEGLSTALACAVAGDRVVLSEDLWLAVLREAAY